MFTRIFAKISCLSLVTFFAAFTVSAQSDIERLADVERAFAKAALEKGTKSAFLEFMSRDALVFTPDRALARDHWTTKPESPGALIWAPNYGDVSSNGILGYTTGNWELRPKGKDDAPGAFGQFVTVWVRQPSGQYRWVLDIGISHAKPVAYSDAFAPAVYNSTGNSNNISAADSANGFYKMVGERGAQRAYAAYTDERVRFFRENEMPGVGRGALLDRIKKDRSALVIPKRSVFFETADMAYVNSTYTRVSENGTSESGNFLHIWKLIDGKWKIVLDIFKPVPQKTN